MFTSLSEKLEKVFKKLRSYGKLTEENIKEVLREVRIALLEADVNFKIVKEFIGKVKDRAVGTEVLRSLTPGQQIIDIVHDEMIELLGREYCGLSFAKKPSVIMLVGLQGSGKTTTVGKLAYWLKENRKGKTFLIAADTYRPAAREQLVVLGKELEVEVFYKKGEEATSLDTCREGIARAAALHVDTVIIDTAGRLQIDEGMMKELCQLKTEADPEEILLVVDAMTGQEAVNVADIFNKEIGINGIVLTKMDGDARGGAALSVKAVTGKPIKFIGVGEKLDCLEAFYPDRMASRILGMGDVLSLIEKAKKSFEEKDALQLEKKLKNNSFTLDDFLSQMQQIKKMGSIEQIINMIPGMNKFKGVKPDEGQLGKVEAIIYSMTKHERNNHIILNGSRRKRIACGSGTSVSEVNKLLKQFTQMKKMMKKFSRQTSKGNLMLGKGMFS